MPTEFGDELDPRSVIPLSDSEIEELYAEARQETASPAKGPEAMSTLYPLAVLDALTSVILLEILSRGRVMGLALVVLLLLVIVASFALVVNGMPAGILTYLQIAKLKKGTKPDLSDLKVLAVVVERIASQPLKQASILQRKIEKDRHAIADSLSELDHIEATLRDELRGATDESMRLLLQSRRDSAQRAIARLKELDAELAQQMREASEAVKPVIQMREKFERLSRLSTSLSRIQAAHRLADNASDAVQEQKLELQILRSVVQEANAKLLDIERLVDAQDRARAELGL